MRNSNKKCEMVLMCLDTGFFTGKKDAKPVGLMGNPDESGPVFVDRVGYIVSSEQGLRRNTLVPMNTTPFSSRNDLKHRSGSLW